ncbi:hypothetical protein D3C73_822230 [compost metagenome]
MRRGFKSTLGYTIADRDFLMIRRCRPGVYNFTARSLSHDSPYVVINTGICLNVAFYTRIDDDAAA